MSKVFSFTKIEFSLLFSLFIFHAFSIASLFTNIGPGALTSLVIIFFIITNIRKILYKINKYNISFYFLLAITAISSLNYVLNDIVNEFLSEHIDAIFKIISYLVIPQFFYFLAGFSIEKTEGNNINKIVKIIVSLNFISIISAIILYYTMPDFYYTYAQNILSDIFNFEESNYPRMIGYYGNSMLMGIVCSITIPLAFMTNYNGWIRLLIVSTAIIGSILTLQRASIITSILSFIFLIAINYKKTNITRKNILQILFFAIIFLISISILIDTSTFELISSAIDRSTDRLGTLGESLNEREDQYQQFSQAFFQHPLGLGIGMMSHVTAGYQFKYSVPDSNYLRILGEINISGLISFLLTVIISIINGYKNKNYNLIVVVLIYLVIATGTNAFDFYYASYIFWFSLGVLCASNFKKIKVKEF